MRRKENEGCLGLWDQNQVHRGRREGIHYASFMSIGMSSVMIEQGAGLSLYLPYLSRVYIILHRSCPKRQLSTSKISRLVHKFIFSYSEDRGQEYNSAPSECSGQDK